MSDIPEDIVEALEDEVGVPPIPLKTSLPELKLNNVVFFKVKSNATDCEVFIGLVISNNNEIIAVETPSKHCLRAIPYSDIVSFAVLYKLTKKEANEMRPILQKLSQNSVNGSLLKNQDFWSKIRELDCKKQ